jgi:predicted GIY-YIG superfamily endonuclease
MGRYIYTHIKQYLLIHFLLYDLMNLLMKCILATFAAPSKGMPSPHVLGFSTKSALHASLCAPQNTPFSKLASSSYKLPAQSLAKSLQLYRAHQASTNKITSSNVFGDKVIKAIVMKRPATLEKLQSISGIGHKRILKYGIDILQLIFLHRKKIKKLAKKAVLKKSTGNSASAKVPKRPRPRPRPKPTQPRPYGPRCASPTYQETTGKELAASAKVEEKPASVYILELENGRVYVGTSKDVERRISQHINGCGAAFTRTFKPTGKILPRLGNVSGSGDAAERDETLRYMYLKGMLFVRGWKYTQLELSVKDYEDAESNIRELYDLCRRCGGKGHFVSQCRCTRDRFGDLIN